jgi:hypothetical protein
MKIFAGKTEKLFWRISVVALLSSSASVCLAETPKDAAVAEPNSSTVATPAETTPSTAGGASPENRAKGDTGSAASIDNFIPGSEVMPAPQTRSDDFIKSQKPTMDLAILLHKNREYKQSLMVLEKLPPNEKTRYYSGLCYKALGNQKAATDQFAWVAYYAKDQQLKGYALAAIRAMRPVKPTKAPKGYCTSSIYTSAEARNRAEEIQARISAEQRSKFERGEVDERGQFRSNWKSGSQQ